MKTKITHEWAMDLPQRSHPLELSKDDIDHGVPKKYCANTCDRDLVDPRRAMKIPTV